MNKNRCPYCNEKVSYWDKLKPAFALKQRFITCPSCNKKVSEYWIKIAMSIAFSGVAAGTIASNSKNAVLYILVTIACVIISFMWLATTIELKPCDELTLEKMQAEYIARETSVNLWRVALIVIASIIIFAALIWLGYRG